MGSIIDIDVDIIARFCFIIRGVIDDKAGSADGKTSIVIIPRIIAVNQ